MYIKNPNKKESYSFRINPELLQKIKDYAKATDQTVPEILNDMIEDKVKDLNLTNDYLENKLNFNGVISLPPLTEIYDNGNYKEFNLFTERSNKVLYEIQRVPNNLDIWTDNEGYKSDKRGVNHEGLSFVLAPELINNPEYLQTPELLFCCLIPIYFRVNINQIRKSTVYVTNISFDKAFKMINHTKNLELLDEFTRFTNMVKELILAYTNRLKNATENPDGTFYCNGYTYSDKNQLLLDLYSKLVIELSEYSINVNVNVLSHYDSTIKRHLGTDTDNDNILVSDNPYLLLEELKEKDRTIEELKRELDEVKQNQIELIKDIDKKIEERIKNYSENNTDYEELFK